MEFKVGDKVQYDNTICNFTGTIVGIDRDCHILRDDWVKGKGIGGAWTCHANSPNIKKREPLEWIAPSYTASCMTNADMGRAFNTNLWDNKPKNSKTAKLMEAGLMCEDGRLTSEGREELEGILLDQHKETLVAIASGIIKANKPK